MSLKLFVEMLDGFLSKMDKMCKQLSRGKLRSVSPPLSLLSLSPLFLSPPSLSLSLRALCVRVRGSIFLLSGPSALDLVRAHTL